LPAAQVRSPWPRSGRWPAYLPLLFVVRRRAGPCFVLSVVRWRHGFSPFPPWPGAEAAARALLTALAVRREEPVGAVAGRRVAARDPFLLRRPTSRGRSLPDGRPGCRVLTWPNERPRNWPGIVGRDTTTTTLLLHQMMESHQRFGFPFTDSIQKPARSSYKFIANELGAEADSLFPPPIAIS